MSESLVFAGVIQTSKDSPRHEQKAEQTECSELRVRISVAIRIPLARGHGSSALEQTELGKTCRIKASKNKMNPDTTKTIFICYGFLLLAGLLLAIPGIIWANREKVIVYHGKADLILSCVTLPFVVISLVDLSFEDWFSWAIHFAGVILFSCSVWMSYKANQNIGKIIIVVATKFALVGIIAFCALLALEGLVGGIKAQKKRDYEGAAAKYITGALGAFGVYHLHKLIAKFVRENPIVT